MTKQYERHPLSAKCGNMTAEEFIPFEASILAEGVREAVIIWRGKVLDGWHRYSTATKHGLECPLESFEGTASEAIALVLRKHNRRNWTPSQRAFNVVEINSWMDDEEPGSSFVKTEVELAAEAEVSTRTIRQAKVVHDRGTEEVKAKVRDGDLSVKQAEKIARKPKKEQKKAMEAPAWRPMPGAAPLPRPVVGASTAALDELKERNAILCEENDALAARLAIHFMEGTDEEKLAASVLIADLQSQVKVLTAELNAVKATRNHLQEERSEMLKQLSDYRKRLDNLTKKAA
jgi:hypothetical protein